MLNRVFLLISGFAFGWTAVQCLTAPADKLRGQWAGLALSLAAGGLMIASLGVASPAAGGAALGTFFVSALVAYAGHARQINKPVASPERRKPERPIARDARCAVLLVCDGPPRTYDDPAAWAKWLRHAEAEGRPMPHWFVHPWIYARIRAAYRAMGGQHPFHAAMEELVQALQTRLGVGYCCQPAYLYAEPRLLDALVRLTEQGLSAIVLIPLGLEDAHPKLRAQVVESRVIEIGVRVNYAPALEIGLGPLNEVQTWLDHEHKGIDSTPQLFAPEAIETIYERVLATVGARAED